MFTPDYADLNGVRLHYVTDGAGPPILLLHGNPEFWYAWKQQLTEAAGSGQPAIRAFLAGRFT
jgi:epoxide hydrolase 4